jgi:peptidoglycan/LPS O-acetylase OafA/YrhL
MRAQRLESLDALRGILACIVVAHHALEFAGLPSLSSVIASNLAVVGFFVMSGHVLARSYDGHALAFVARRLVRLWPVYAVCVIAGYAALGRLPPPLELLWWPISPFDRPTIVDKPDWTLYCEVWAAPLMPAMFWVAARHRGAALAMAAGSFALVLLDARLFPLGLFAAGIAASRFALHLPVRAPGWALSLGRVSYSLYLSHWVVMNVAARLLGPAGIVVALLAVFPVAWALWRWVERPSIGWSRAAGARVAALW